MKSALFGFILSAALFYSHAQEDGKPKEGEIKIYKRLIPADVLRGEWARLIDEQSVNLPPICDSRHEQRKSDSIG